MLIYFLEDDQDVAYVIKKTLKKANYQAVGFVNGHAFLKTYDTKKPDLVILDVMLPDISGIDVLKLIRKDDIQIPVIMLSAKSSEIDKVIALDLGADDYISKPFSVIELTSRIQTRLRHLVNMKITYKDITIDDEKYEISINDNIIYFTNKEYMILKYLIQSNGKVVDKETLFLKVWDTNYMGETRTLDMHIKSIRNKLKNSDAKIITVRGVGYQLI